MDQIGPQAQEWYGMRDLGCYVDGIWGIHAGQHAQEIAREHEWPGYPDDYTPAEHDDCIADWDAQPTLPRHAEIDHGIYYDEATNEAEEFLNTFTDDDVAFGWVDGSFLLLELAEVG